MAVKGQILKKEISEKILSIFPGSFLYNDGKEIRILGTEEGESIQIKVTLTAAKTAVEIGSDTETPGAAAGNTINSSTIVNSTVIQSQSNTEVTVEEKQNIAKMLEALGL